jgi:ribosome-associated protein
MSERTRIPVKGNLSIGSDEIEESFIRSSGPGGQNVNKVATAVQIRFNVRLSPSLPVNVKERLMRLAGSRLTKEGEIVMTAERFRTQERNRADAAERLVELIARACEVEKPRRATRPTLASKERRHTAKHVRGSVKAMRGRPSSDD